MNATLSRPPARHPLLVPTLCVGTPLRTLCVPSKLGTDGTQSVPLTVPTRSVGTRKWALLRWSPILLLAGLLVFCHGCHGEDEDNELSAGFPQMRQIEEQRPAPPAVNGQRED